MVAVVGVHFLPAAASTIDGAIRSWAGKWPEGYLGFVLGVLFAAVMQVVRNAIVWASWWLVKRR